MSDKKNQAECVECDKFGERIRQVRKNLGLVQTDFGDSLGVSLATITRMERGVFKPQGDFLAKLALTYDCDIRWLLTGEEQNVAKGSEVVRDPAIFNLLKSQRNVFLEIVAEVEGEDVDDGLRLKGVYDKLAYLDALLAVGNGPE